VVLADGRELEATIPNLHLYMDGGSCVAAFVGAYWLDPVLFLQYTP